MSDVFVSYKAEDRPRVERLVKALEAEGLSVWWDAHVGGGEAWREQIAEQLEAAPCVIVVWSSRSTGPEGRFVRDEASRAARRGTYLPVTIDDVDPPLGFGEMQALSLIGWKGDLSDPHFHAVSACVHSMLGRKVKASTAPKPPLRVSRRTALAATGGAIVATAGAAGWLFVRPSGAKANTIAVLPFANLSGDRAEDYFSDGMAEEVRAALAALGSLHVVARTSSEMLRNADAVTAARRLDVANVVTGSVRRSPSTIRVNAQLVDGHNGIEQWSQSFDRPVGDVLQIQSDIAANVARALSVELGGVGASVTAIGGTKNPQAQDLLLQATASEGDDTSDAMLHRIALLDQALRIDPSYAEAYARRGLQQELWSSAYSASAEEKDRGEANAAQSARRSIAIAPDLALGHTTLGLIYHNQLAMKQSLAALKKAAELPSADTVSFVNYGLALVQVGRQAEALTVVDRAIRVDPLNPIARMMRSYVLFYSRKYPEAIDAARQVLAIVPQNVRARSFAAWSLILLGRLEEGSAEAAKLPADDYRRFVAEGAVAARSGRKADGLAAIRAIEGRYGDAAYYQEGEVFAQLGLVDQALTALETAWEKRDSGLTSMQVDPFLDPVRKDPRFAKLATRVFG